MLVLSIAVFVVCVVVVRSVARRIMIYIIEVAHKVPPRITGSWAWARSQPFRSRLAKNHPTLFSLAADRLDPRKPTGLPLALVILTAIYLAALFSGITEDILEAEGTIRIDNIVNAAFRTWRVEPLVSAFRWITALGSSPAVVTAAIIATGFLWSQRRFYFIISLWVTCLGALATTTIGKLIIGRHRPEFAIDVNVVSSSFPSGHATAAMAVYGFIAYAIARALIGCSRTLRGHLLDYGSHSSNWLQPYLFGCPLRNGCYRRIPRWWVLAAGWLHHCRMECISRS